jgi:hypothetical protein
MLLGRCGQFLVAIRDGGTYRSACFYSPEGALAGSQAISDTLRFCDGSAEQTTWGTIEPSRVFGAPFSRVDVDQRCTLDAGVDLASEAADR